MPYTHERLAYVARELLAGGHPGLPLRGARTRGAISVIDRCNGCGRDYLTVPLGEQCCAPPKRPKKKPPREPAFKPPRKLPVDKGDPDWNLLGLIIAYSEQVSHDGWVTAGSIAWEHYGRETVTVQRRCAVLRLHGYVESKSHQHNRASWRPTNKGVSAYERQVDINKPEVII